MFCWRFLFLGVGSAVLGVLGGGFKFLGFWLWWSGVDCLVPVDLMAGCLGFGVLGRGAIVGVPSGLVGFWLLS